MIDCRTDAPTPPLGYPANFGNRINVPDDNPTTQQGVFLGRVLFYEPLLSANGKLSCGSCHKQELAFTDGQQFSPGFDGTPTERNSMSLANLLWRNVVRRDIPAGFAEFARIGVITTPITLAIAVLGLWVGIRLFGV